MSQEDYDEYKEGYEAGEEAAEETDWGDKVQDHVDVWMGRHDDKSEMWWKGFHDGKEGNWDPPSDGEEDRSGRENGRNNTNDH